MKKLLIMTLLFSVTSLSARIWTSSDGRKIEAKFISLKNGKVSIQKKGKTYHIPLEKLSEADQKYARELAKAADGKKDENTETNTPATDTSLKGVKLSPGKRANIEFDLNPKVIKALANNKLKPTKAKVSIILPKGFDPKKPQKVFWPVGGINNETERLHGNLGRLGPMQAEAHKRGWIVIAADTEHGNPRETTIAEVKGDLEFHQQILEEISKEWPEFKSWKHACGGNSSGAKASFFRVAQLLKSEANVVGVFLAGCNQSLASAAASETRVRKKGIRKVRVWLSHGDKDHLVNADYTAKVLSGIKDGGYRIVRSESFKGGHSMNQTEYGKALEWFIAED